MRVEFNGAVPLLRPDCKPISQLKQIEPLTIHIVISCPAGDYNLHHVCAFVTVSHQFSLKLLQLHIFGKLLVPMYFYALQYFFGLVKP